MRADNRYTEQTSTKYGVSAKVRNKGRGWDTGVWGHGIAVLNNVTDSCLTAG